MAGYLSSGLSSRSPFSPMFHGKYTDGSSFPNRKPHGALGASRLLTEAGGRGEGPWDMGLDLAMPVTRPR